MIRRLRLIGCWLWRQTVGALVAAGIEAARAERESALAHADDGGRTF